MDSVLDRSETHIMARRRGKTKVRIQQRRHFCVAALLLLSIVVAFQKLLETEDSSKPPPTKTSFDAWDTHDVTRARTAASPISQTTSSVGKAEKSLQTSAQLLPTKGLLKSSSGIGDAVQSQDVLTTTPAYLQRSDRNAQKSLYPFSSATHSTHMSGGRSGDKPTELIGRRREAKWAKPVTQFQPASATRQQVSDTQEAGSERVSLKSNMHKRKRSVNKTKTAMDFDVNSSARPLTRDSVLNSWNESSRTAGQRPAIPDDPCQEPSVRLTDTEGQLRWEERKDTLPQSWLIDVDPSGSSGVVIKFQELRLPWGETGDHTLTVYECSGMKAVKTFRRTSGNLPVIPVLVHSSTVLIRLNKTIKDQSKSSFTPGQTKTTLQGVRTKQEGQYNKHEGCPCDGEHDNGTRRQGQQAIIQTQSSMTVNYTVGDRGQNKERRTGAAEEGARFTLTYTAQSLETLPPAVHEDRYNCSPPYHVPEALRCDMAEQCVGGEDERHFNCTYREAECGDWIPYGPLFCARFLFADKAFAPISMEEKCGLASGDSLPLVFGDQTLKQLAANITALHGQDSLLTGIMRSQTNAESYGYLYRFIWGLDSGMTRRIMFPMFSIDIKRMEPHLDCSILNIIPEAHLRQVSCMLHRSYFFACLILKKYFFTIMSNPLPPVTVADFAATTKVSLKRCLEGSFTHLFQSCEGGTDDPGEFRPFLCKNGNTVHYSLVCDGVDDCRDFTDEQDCSEAAPFADELYFGKLFVCRHSRNVHVIPASQQCDGRPDCFDGSDEENCESCAAGLVNCLGWGCVPHTYVTQDKVRCVSMAGNVMLLLQTAGEEKHKVSPDVRYDVSALQRLDLDGYGMAVWTDLPPGSPCPETHVRCVHGPCIPSYLVKNFVFDCPNLLANEEITETQSDGYYRCHTAAIRLHPHYVCDGVYQCPLKDDERYCNLTCPQNCTCEGYAFKCSQMFEAEEYPLLRYLDLSGVLRPELENIKALLLLRLLNLSSCGLAQLPPLPRAVKVLDLSFNQLTIQAVIYDTYRSHDLLTHLNLSGNMLESELNESFSSRLSHRMAALESLDLSNTGIRNIKSNSFKTSKKLQVLDIRNNELTTERATFAGLAELRILLTDERRVCCLHSHLYPEAKTDCIAPTDELSSCSDLLRSDFFRVVLWMLSVLALAGNVGVLVYRLCAEAQGTSSGYRVLVTNLSLSDLLMGLYLLMVGAADAHYKGDYLWKRDEWTHSTACRVAGFLALVSSEVSTFIICLITLDRLLVLSLPLKRHLHMKTRSAVLTCVGAWLVGVVLAVLPLLMADWWFYGQNGICLPLPITSHQFPGRQYAFGVFIVLNFLLFLAVGAGQMLIYRAIRVMSLAGVSGRRRQDMAIARRLALVVFTDFCCWFPIGLLGLLASQGMPVPGVVNVWMAILVLPLNSAINPFLYTLGTLLQRRARRREEQRIQRLLGRLHADIVTWPVDKLADLSLHVERALRRAREEQCRTTSSV